MWRNNLCVCACMCFCIYLCVCARARASAHVCDDMYKCCGEDEPGKEIGSYFISNGLERRVQADESVSWLLSRVLKEVRV